MNNPTEQNAARPLDVVQRLGKVCADVAEFSGQTATASLADTLSHWLTAHYAAAASVAAEEAGGAGVPLSVLRDFSAPIGTLRRGDHRAAHLLIEEKWIDIERSKSRERMEALFEQWEKHPEKHRRPGRHRLSKEERAARIREILRYPNQPVPASSDTASDPTPSQP